ncbi:MAG: hypothetical protein ACRDBG_05140, partial [Waterburya sp.]
AKYAKQLSTLSPASQKEYVENRLKALTLYKNERSNDTSFVKEERSVLSQLLLELEQTSEANLRRDTDDISGLVGQFKNLSDISHPAIQALNKRLLKTKSDLHKEYREITEEHDQLLKQVLIEKSSNTETRRLLKQGATLTLAAGVASVGTLAISPFLIAAPLITYLYLYRSQKSPKETFNFLWRKDPVSSGYYLNLTDSYEENGVQKRLTASEIKYRDFLKDKMQSTYSELINTYAYDTVSGKALTYAQSMGLPTELSSDFMPRTPKSVDELRLEQSFIEGYFGLKTRISDFVRKNLTSFFEDNFETTQPSGGMPIRYMMAAGSPVVEASLHTFNPEESFKLFIGNLLTKKYYDPLYALAHGVKDSLEIATDERGKQKYPNLTKFLDRQISLQIAKDTPKDNLTSKEIKFELYDITAKSLGLPEGTQIRLNQDQVLRALKAGVSFTIMSFKAVNATLNGALIGLT